MSNYFFGKDAQKPVYSNVLLQNEIVMCKARINEAHQALQRLKQDIDNRCVKLQGTFDFLESKQALYEQLIARYKQKPSATMATRIQKLHQAIEDRLANIQAAQPEKVIADLNSDYEALKLELARKEALITRKETLINSEPLYQKGAGMY